MTPRRAAAAIVAVSVLLAVVGSVLALGQRGPRAASYSPIRPNQQALDLAAGATFCQPGVALARDARALELYADPHGAAGPALDVAVWEGAAPDAVTGAAAVRSAPGAGGARGRPLARGTAGAGYAGGALAVPLDGPARTADVAATVCVANRGAVPVGLAGLPAGAGTATHITVDQLRATDASWWSAAGAVLARTGVLRGHLGGAAPVVLVAGWLAMVALALWLALAGAVPRAAWCCALVGVLSALAWGLLTPPFQAPDEPHHVAYVQVLAETGRLPTPERSAMFSSEERAAYAAARIDLLIGPHRGRPPWLSSERRAAERALAAPGLARDDGGAPTNAGNNPPLYYALQAVPYRAVRAVGGDFFDRLAAMRLFAALFVGATVLCVFGFLRELVPEAPAAQRTGALAVALAPLLGFSGGTVNNDTLMCVWGAALLLVLARVLRRGLTWRLAVALGAVTTAGLVTKYTMVAFLPAIVLALVLAVRRAPREGSLAPDAAAPSPDTSRWALPRRAAGEGTLAPVAAPSPHTLRWAALRRAAAVLGLAAAVFGLYLVGNATVWNRPFMAPSGPPLGQGPFHLLDAVSYAWEFYLPKLGFMTDQLQGAPWWRIWFRGLIGEFGRLDYGFPEWVAFAGAGFLAALAVPVARLLVAARGRWRAHAGEVAVYALMVLGLLALVAKGGYDSHRANLGFEQARYLLPLAGLYGAFVALAIRGAGRWGAALAAAATVVFLAHDTGAQLLTLVRYYA